MCTFRCTDFDLFFGKMETTEAEVDAELKSKTQRQKVFILFAIQFAANPPSSLLTSQFAANPPSSLLTSQFAANLPVRC